MLVSDRFSPDQITDPLMRLRMYREIRQQTPLIHRKHWAEHTIAPSEVLAPDLIAYRVYQNKNLKWVVLAAAGLDDYRRTLESGDTLMLPDLEWLRDRIRYYLKQQEINVTPAPVLARAQLAEASEVPDIELPSDPGAIDALRAALAELSEPIPVISTSERISDETLNRQRNAIQRKMKAVADALALLEVR